MALVTSQLQPGLSFLVQPTETSHFKTAIWQQKPWLGALDLSLDGLIDSLAASSVPQLLRLARSSVLVKHYTVEGRYRGTYVTPRQAYDLFKSNLALYFDLSPNAPAISAWITSMARDLGQKTDSIRLSIFAAPKGTRTECHFDSNENFTIQLRGKKRWRMAPNTRVVSPVERFTISGNPAPALSLYVEESLEGEPLLSETADLVPGSMLYVPRGYWHDVEALEESVSLNICITPEVWLTYLLPLIERRLLAEKAWREVTAGVRGTADERQSARRKISHLLETLGDILADFSPEETVPMPNGASITDDRAGTALPLRRSRTALLLSSVDEAADGDQLCLTVEAANNVSNWTAPIEALPFYTWIGIQHEVIAEIALMRFSELPRSLVFRTLRQLVDSGFLYCD